jgi:beta-1,2-mannosidase
MEVRHLSIAVLAIWLTNCTPQEKKSVSMADTTWAILPFIKVDSVNPILAPDKGIFFCPILKKNVNWEEKDVFNPAAVVRHDSVYLIYRAEDTIGKYAGTSRLGLAASADGLHFTRRREPIFFPAEDFMKKYEWEGGVEDPRIVESEG